MSRLVGIIALLAGVALAAAAWIFYNEANKQDQRNENLRDLLFELSDAEDGPAETPVEVVQTSTYDPTDLDQTPPGVEVFLASSACSMQWGLQVRQYCERGDQAEIDTVEGGFSAIENMEFLIQCLDDSLVRRDTYGRNLSYLESEVEQNEANRHALSCELVDQYGTLEAFDRASVYYMIKEHVESGNINRLLDR